MADTSVDGTEAPPVGKTSPAYVVRRNTSSYVSQATLSPRIKDKMATAYSALARDAYCVLDAQLNCHYMSDNWLTISGFDARDEGGDGFCSHIAPDHLNKVRAYLAGVEDATSPVRFQFKHHNGQWHWCELQVAEIDDDGMFNCLLKDITEWVSNQSKMEKSKLEAELATKSRSEFLANMSHELRTPLNAILGFAQMIEAGTYGSIGHPKYNDYINDIQKSGSTLLSKVNDLLEIANIDAGRMSLDESDVDVGQIIHQAIEFHSHRAFRKQVMLRNHLPETPVIVRADRIRLLQVLTNLIANAITYSHENGIVDVYCAVRHDGGVSLSVKDNGIGIAPSHLDNILTAFGQDNSFFARTRDCVGLGLALSKEIVKLHQGRIMIESKQGEGTHFTVRLPRERTLSQKRKSKPVLRAEMLAADMAEAG